MGGSCSHGPQAVGDPNVRKCELLHGFLYPSLANEHNRDVAIRGGHGKTEDLGERLSAVLPICNTLHYGLRCVHLPSSPASALGLILLSNEVEVRTAHIQLCSASCCGTLSEPSTAASLFGNYFSRLGEVTTFMTQSLHYLYNIF